MILSGFLSEKWKICSFPSCMNRMRSNGYCRTHSEQLRRTGIVKEVRDPQNLCKGYRMIYKPDHPNADKSGRIPEHRLVMSELLGRPLYDFENVHHKNGSKIDNSKENLELWITKQPYGQRIEDMVAWAKQILSLYQV